MSFSFGVYLFNCSAGVAVSLCVALGSGRASLSHSDSGPSDSVFGNAEREFRFAKHASA